MTTIPDTNDHSPDVDGEHTDQPDDDRHEYEPRHAAPDNEAQP